MVFFHLGVKMQGADVAPGFLASVFDSAFFEGFGMDLTHFLGQRPV